MMFGTVSDTEKQIFREAYDFFERHCSPLANGEDGSLEFWESAADDVCTTYDKWLGHPLMSELLTAIYSYLDSKAKERTKELEDFQ